MENSWKEMSSAEKREARFQKWLAAEGIQFENPQAETNYRAAIERFKNVAFLEKLPDRIPVIALGTFMPTQVYDVTPYEAMYDVDKMLSTNLKFLNDFKPDFSGSPALIGCGKIFEILGYKQYKWPGYNLPKESGYQCPMSMMPSLTTPLISG
jgi:hypothetical protein